MTPKTARVDPPKQFLAWWNSNWPDLAPAHQALQAFEAGYALGMAVNWNQELRLQENERITKAKAILEASSGMEGWVENDIQNALAALDGK